MSINGIESLIYSVSDLDASTRFFTDFGLKLVAGDAASSHFRLPDGANIVLHGAGSGELPATSQVVGDGVHEVIWGLDTSQALNKLAAELAIDREISWSVDGTARFLSDFGVPMALRVFDKRPTVCAPDPINAPGHVRRLNQHRKWRKRALPRTLAHVVFAVPDYEAGARFLIDRLQFRLSDSQRGFGKYLRADGTNSHHTILLLNANAPIPGMDGVLRFHHANFAVEDIDEIMVGANHMARQGWDASHFGLGRHRIDSALFYYIPCPAGGEAEYGADSDYVDDSWVPRNWVEPLFGYSHFVHNLPPFLQKEPDWRFEYLVDGEAGAEVEAH